MGTGAQKPSPLPSFLACSGLHSPDNWGGKPQPHVQDVSPRGRPGVRRTGDTQGQTYPLIQIEGLWGRGRERKKSR